MPSNLRARPIEGYITDSAGNVIRNARIVIKQISPSGAITADSINADSDGYFISKPLKNGLYDVYESGVRIIRTTHSPSNTIQCFKADPAEYRNVDIGDFADLKTAGNLNAFKAFIQIESDQADVAVYGNSFPIYDEDVRASIINSNMSGMAQFYNFLTDSRVTTTRFDVEYFAPITSTNKVYKRIRWAGVPAIRMRSNSKLIIPLDYYSIIPSLPKATSPGIINFDSSGPRITHSSTETYITRRAGQSVDNSDFISFYDSLSIGDIVKVDAAAGTYYGIVNGLSGSPSNNEAIVIKIEIWKSTVYTSNTLLSSSNVNRLRAFDGMFSGISSINDEANERFSVVENSGAQNQTSEMYGYQF